MLEELAWILIIALFEPFYFLYLIAGPMMTGAVTGFVIGWRLPRLTRLRWKFIGLGVGCAFSAFKVLFDWFLIAAIPWVDNGYNFMGGIIGLIPIVIVIWLATRET